MLCCDILTPVDSNRYSKVILCNNGSYSRGWLMHQGQHDFGSSDLLGYTSALSQLTFLLCKQAMSLRLHAVGWTSTSEQLILNSTTCGIRPCQYGHDREVTCLQSTNKGFRGHLGTLLFCFLCQQYVCKEIDLLGDSTAHNTCQLLLLVPTNAQISLFTCSYSNIDMMYSSSRSSYHHHHHHHHSSSFGENNKS